MPPWAIPTKISKAWACPRTSTFVHRSDDRTTTARADLMAPRLCIVVWPPHLASQRIRAKQSTRPKRLMTVSSFGHRETALSLQAAYSDYQIGAFENFHQLVEDTLVVLRPGPKVFLQYKLRFVNRLKSQLLISHAFLPIKQMPPGGRQGTRNQAAFGKYPHFFELSDQFLFQCEKPSAHDRGGFLVQHRFRSRLTGYSQQ
jgi:hypothetical protein